MQFSMRAMTSNRKIWLVGKIIVSMLLLLVFLQSLFLNGIRPYQSYKDFESTNIFSPETSVPVSEMSVSQTFISEGNLLNNLSVYLAAGSDQNVLITLSDSQGKVLKELEFRTADYSQNAWNTIGFSCDGLKRGQAYTISFSGENILNFLVINTAGSSGIFQNCFDASGEMDGSLAIGFQFTYTYLTLGSIFEIFIKVFSALILWLLLSYTVFHIETMWIAFKQAEKKAGLPYAAFFAVIVAMLFNPLASARNQMTKFSRVIGTGVVSGVDVSKRVSNFYVWYLLFGLAFVGFYLLFNALHHVKKGEEAEKAQRFLDHFIVLANCGLLIKCINYFQENTQTKEAFHLSEYVMLLIVGMAAAYIFFHLDRCISVEKFCKLCFIGACLSYPLNVIIATEWDSGRILLGILFILEIGIVLFVKLGGGRLFSRSGVDSLLQTGVFVLSFAPLMTSVYIELIHVLNQWGIFVAHPAKYYKVACLLGFVIWILAAAIFNKKKIRLPQWKQIVFPLLVLGFACLANQIPLSQVYPVSETNNSHIFEEANAGILINDFLNFGVIPNVEHYGGHMMMAVWEGILYGIVNRDFAGAFVSPYSPLFDVFLCVLFYYLVKYVWNENIALFAALLFPFYASWNYYGLGMLICLAAMAYIKKPTYPKAILVWAAFIWCAFYRLDLGTAFGLALIISMAIYCIVKRDVTVAKQLSITLIGWAIGGTCLWCILCIAKQVNPISRLLEFLMVNFSNQNWAYAEIGDPSLASFSWFYVIIPFLMVVSLIYVLFSKELRKRIGPEKWLMLMIFGWSYFINIPRGLVRHSLFEMATKFMTWCGYLFLAMTVSFYKKNPKLFLPSFLVLILCGTLFVSDANFSESPMLETAVAKPSSIVESWNPGRFDEKGENTYWEQLKADGQIVQRVQFTEGLQQYADKYKVIEFLLEDDETFVDFTNKTLLYCMLGRECPVYISQSPLQLSGEFMQEKFVEEIEGIPIVLMPAELEDNYSIAMDGITNAYKYYKISEYIYQNYQPLYKYGADYSIWCLPEKYTEYREKLTDYLADTEYVSSLLDSEGLIFDNLELSAEEGTSVVAYTQADPMIMELQTLIDLSPFMNLEMVVNVAYETDNDGTMKLYYTTVAGENYQEEKSETVAVSGEGVASFTVPVTEYTRIRLDLPDQATVKIRSLSVGGADDFISYGYDGPVRSVDENGTVSYSYVSSNHNHTLKDLPRIWAEGDVKKSSENSVLQKMVKQNDVYLFEADSINRANGNYLKISATYNGNDTGGLFEADDESIDGIVTLGTYEDDGQFKPKYRYIVTFKEGYHDYMIRCSADYYWYLGDVNAVQIEANEQLSDVTLYLLEGD